MQRFPRFALLGFAALALGACADQSPTALDALSAPSLKKTSSGTGDFMILGVGETLPADLDAKVAAAGGTLVQSFPEFGVAIARATRSDFAARAASIAGVETVTEDRIVDFNDPNLRVVEFDGVMDAPTEQVASIGSNEPFFVFQWAPTAINAPEAWNAGYTGSGVRVAIIDGGMYAAHPDLAPNVDVAASRSFVAGYAFNADVGTFWHGTHVAGIVAAADNTLGTIGIAPNATLIGIKALHNGSGSFTAIINSVYYAATPVAENGAGAQVINMSLGALILDAKAKADKKDINELKKAVDRATKYAWKQGVVVVAAAGNDAFDLDSVNDALMLPGQSQHVIGVSSTGPLLWALGAQDFSRLASYSNIGTSVVDLSAPGGDFAYPGNELCVVAGIRNPCWAFDMYLSTTRTGWSWAAGTSMASPVVAGVAALIIQKAGGNITPAGVEAELRRGAMDLGKPGNDAVYGHGWVNAFGSVR